jgi:hypothetical protein
MEPQPALRNEKTALTGDQQIENKKQILGIWVPESLSGNVDPRSKLPVARSEKTTRFHSMQAWKHHDRMAGMVQTRSTILLLLPIQHR